MCFLCFRVFSAFCAFMIFFRLLLFPAIVFFVSLGLLAAGLFDIWPWLDIPLHLLGGFSIGVSGRVLMVELEKRHILQLRRWWLRALFVLSLVALLTVLWEIYELILNLIFGVNTQLGVPDTVTDQIFGIVGGILSMVYFWEKKNT